MYARLLFVVVGILGVFSDNPEWVWAAARAVPPLEDKRKNRDDPGPLLGTTRCGGYRLGPHE
jgi:hypothetical protein